MNCKKVIDSFYIYKNKNIVKYTLLFYENKIFLHQVEKF